MYFSILFGKECVHFLLDILYVRVVLRFDHFTTSILSVASSSSADLLRPSADRRLSEKSWDE